MSIDISTLAVIERYVRWIKEKTGLAASLEVSAGAFGGWDGRVVSHFEIGKSLTWQAVIGHSLLAAVENLAGRLTVEERRGWSLEPLDRWKRLCDEA